MKTFLTKVELETSLKDYADEKKANFLASRLCRRNVTLVRIEEGGRYEGG